MLKKHCKNKQNVKAVLLVGSRDFGRCPLASRLPTAVWPIAGKPVVQRLLRHLASQGVKEAVVCSNADASLLREHLAGIDSPQVEFLDEPLPVGTAGCVRDAAGGETSSLLLVFPAGIASPPNIDTLMRAHQAGKSDLTVMFEPHSKDTEPGNHTAEIYICEPVVLDYIPKEGYCDIKEGLIPNMLRAGRTVRAATLPQSIGNFRNRPEYLAAIANYLENSGSISIDFPHSKRSNSRDVLLADSAKVAPTARIYGPVVAMANAVISEKAVIFGPTIIGRSVTIGQNCLVENSVFWDGSSVGRNCKINSCVIDYDVTVPRNSIVKDQAVTLKQNSKFESGLNSAVSLVTDEAEHLRRAAQPLIDAVNARLPRCAQPDKLSRGILRWAGIGILAAVFLWSYWPGIVELWNIWQISDEYSSGLLVPFLAIYILWARRQRLGQCRIQPSLWGLFAFIAAQAVRYFGLFFMYASAERLSLVLSIASLILLLFGWRLLRQLSSVLLFLCLMLPLPQSVHAAVMLPLQSLATSSAVFCLGMFGYAAIRQGNVIALNGATIAVAEACNGLRMVTSFFIITGLVVLLVQRAWWEKLIVLLSSLPIALLCNAVRLTITAVAFTMLPIEQWEGTFHDFGGYAMMPLALAIVIFELWFLAKLTTVPEETKKQIIVRKSNS